MVIIFAIPDENKIYVCSEKQTKVTTIDDPHLLSFVPNDDILYVQTASIITKKQFTKWLQGEFELENGNSVREPEEVVTETKRYVHPTNNGYITIDDIRTQKYPNGLTLRHKYDFIPISEIGEDVVENSPIFRNLVKKGRIEIVGEEYVRRHQHKITTPSPADAALDRILVPVGTKAEDVVGGFGSEFGSDIAIPVNIRA